MTNFKADFPLLERTIHDKPLVYLDNAASTLKPKVVIDKITDFYTNYTSNVHRGAHTVSDEATSLYEESREVIKGFIGASSSNEIIFTRGTTESINLVASVLAESKVVAGDRIVLSEMEHHSNIVPWQVLAKKVGAKIEVIKVLDNGDLDLEHAKALLSQPTKVFAISHCSNTLGTINSIQPLIQLAKSNGAITVVDAAQSVSAVKVDVQQLDCDFLAFSAHKLFGPFGFGVLYGKESLLNELPPYQTGGSMIQKVTFEETTYLNAPQRFEAGTPHVAGAVGLAEAIKYFCKIDLKDIQKHESHLLSVAHEQLANLGGVNFVGTSPSKVNIVSFNIEGVHHSDIGHLLDQQGVAVRTGHHCTQPLMDRFGIPGTIRASFSIYNDLEDVERLVAAVKKAKEMLS